MKKVVILLGLALAACGDDNPSTHDATPGGESNPNPDGSTDGMNPDGGPPGGTFTAFVIDLVKNHSAASELPVPFASFSTLPDPDATATTNPYATLFM